jgi:hypothetical protein
MGLHCVSELLIHLILLLVRVFVRGLFFFDVGYSVSHAWSGGHLVVRVWLKERRRVVLRKVYMFWWRYFGV